MKTTRFDGKLPADWRVLEGQGEAERVDDRRMTHEEEVIYSYEEERRDDRLPTLASSFFVERKSKTTISSRSGPTRSTLSDLWVTGLAFLVFFVLTDQALKLAAVSYPVASSLGGVITAIGAGIGGAGGVAFLRRQRRRQRGDRR